MKRWGVYTRAKPYIFSSSDVHEPTRLVGDRLETLIVNKKKAWAQVGGGGVAVSE